ncbi:MAG: NYN domain-containing protein [Gemmatimonadaceae bacterium]|nr:NYN domain-containing protein [Gemmatimonadaceae bacterium]
MHRGPQAGSTSASALPNYSQYSQAPNAALLIDFDNVTMGIRSDLQTELKNLLSSDIIKGKVAVQRAYADWRRYPQYVVPLAESSIDMIMAPAYGSSKKNATDIRLAIDAVELMFTRPEIGTFILLSGDSDFSSMVMKLKEYGKYVIGVGIRESSSDLLVMNCDEYYSYNALAGLVKTSDEEQVKRDPWELVTESLARMVRNGDVMRADRLKQVMQDIDNGFDEKDLGMSKFSKFVQEAAQKGLLTLTRLENGQFEIAPPGAKVSATPTVASADVAGALDEAAEKEEGEERGSRRRRGRGRGRGGRDREPREPRVLTDVVSTAVAASEPSVEVEAIPEPDVTVDVTQVAAPRSQGSRGQSSRGPSSRGERPVADKAPVETPRAEPQHAEPHRVETPRVSQGRDSIGLGGERLTRNEAFDLVRKAVAATVKNDLPAALLAVRESAAALLGRDSESLSERNFTRILQDAHDADVIDLRKRGDSWEVAPVQQVEGVSEQLAKHDAAHAPKAPAGPPAPRGMGSRGGSRGGRSSAPPPELLMVGVVDDAPPIAAPVAPIVVKPIPAPDAPALPDETPVGSSPAGRGNGRPAAKKAVPAKVAKAAPAKPVAKKVAPPARKAAAKVPATRAPAAKTAAKKIAKR